MIVAASLCSGIGAPEVAMPGWRWAWCAEVEPFPSAVLAQRHGHPNLGDISAPDFTARAIAAGIPDVLVAGTPCQAFSVAGKREGLGDARGNLTLIEHRSKPAADGPRYRALGNSMAVPVMRWILSRLDATLAARRDGTLPP